jgi:hypothetical protein
MSHRMARMVVRIQYSYTDLNGVTRHGTTDRGEGASYHQTHGRTPANRASLREARDAAEALLPRLQQGERWTYRHHQIHEEDA